MTNSFLPVWLGGRSELGWKFFFLFMDLLEDWFPARCGGWFGRVAAYLGVGLGWGVRAGLPGWLAVAWRAGRGGGSEAGGPLCGLRCGAQPWGGGAELTALCRGQSSVQTAAPSLMWKCAWRRTRPTACAPRHRPSRLPHGPPATPLGRPAGTFKGNQKAEQILIAARAFIY